MSEFEEKLGSILGDPNAMAQIMALAQSLGGSAAPAAPQDAAALPEAGLEGEYVPVGQGEAGGSQAAAPDLSGVLNALGGLDPQLIQSGMELLGQLSSGEDQRVALLLALKPFLKEERYAKIDRAIQIAQLSRVLRVAFQLFKGRGRGDV